MRATKIEVRTRALGPGRHVGGVWEPAGQLVATVWVEQPGAAEEVARRLSRAAEGEEGWTAEVVGRQDTE